MSEITNVRFSSSTPPRWNLLNGVALNGAASTRTIELRLFGGISKLILLVQHTNSSATAITATPTVSIDEVSSSPTYSSIQSRAISSGTATDSDFVDSKSVSGDTNFQLEYDVRGAEWFKCVFAGTGADASDLLTVQASGVIGV
jgi:hypothetical protein